MPNEAEAMSAAKVKVFGTGEPFQEVSTAQPCAAGLSGVQTGSPGR
jgi:hypothetical protein